MKIYYNFFSPLVVGLLITFASCQEDEKLNLVTFPVNQPSITIDNAEGVSQAMLTAVYKSDGTLALDGPITRTYTFHFAASPEVATITFDVLSTNIPRENIEISDTKVVLPAGATDASVTVTLKDEDFSFAEPNYDAVTYELGVKANVEGFKIGVEPIESKVVIKKEAYIAGCSLFSQSGSTVLFERAYSKGEIINSDPISYTFRALLDKPARKDVKVKLITTGLNEQFMSNVTITPAEIIIPAGQLSSGDITWTVTDDFLLTTTEPETHALIVTASTESDDPVVAVNTKESFITFNVSKTLRNFEFLSDMVASWVELSKAGWSVQSSTWGDANVLIDGDGGMRGSDIYTYDGDLWFIVDMKSEKMMNGVGVDYCRNTTASSPRKVTISTSSDNKTWVSQGSVDTPQSFNHYFQFYSPMNVRYVKFEMSGYYNTYIDVTEVYMYNIE